jgi:glycosyltransferase involved in cell wall biosynthesis
MRPQLLFFYTDWCPLCPVIRGHLEGLSVKMADAPEVVPINMDEDDARVKAYEVLGVPTVVAVLDGEKYEALAGARGAEAYISLAEALNAYAQPAATVSLCMIVKNESKTLARCLDAVRDVVDEINIVDTGSTDDTRDIALRYTDRVFDFAWCDDFSAARNFSFAQATGDFILWLDADDVLREGDARRFARLKHELAGVDTVMMRYAIAFDEAGNETFSYFRERLIRRDPPRYWHEPVHEYLPILGHVIQSEITIEHRKIYAEGAGDGTRNLRIYTRQLEEGRELTARGQYYFARELKTHARHREAATMFELFLAQGKGWVEDNICACVQLSDCYQALKEPIKARIALLTSFVYDTPRAEACCRLGYFYKEEGDYARARFWFELALSLQKPESYGFIEHAYWDYIPLAECVVCYAQLGDIDRAEAYNERAAAVRPNAASVTHNRAYFKSLRAGETK